MADLSLHFDVDVRVGVRWVKFLGWLVRFRILRPERALWIAETTAGLFLRIKNARVVER